MSLLFKSLFFLVLTFTAHFSPAVQCRGLLEFRLEQPEKLIFQTDRLEIRPVQNADEVQALIAVLQNKDVERQSGEVIPTESILQYQQESQTSLSEARQALESRWQTLSLFQMGVFLEGKMIGTISFQEFHHTWMSEIRRSARKIWGGDLLERKKTWVVYGIALLPQYHGQGYGSEITEKRLEIAFKLLGADGVLVDIDPQNKASQKLSSRFGFKPLQVSAPWEGGGDIYFLSVEDYEAR